MIVRHLRSNSIISFVFPVLLTGIIWSWAAIAHGAPPVPTDATFFNLCLGWILNMPVMMVAAAFLLLGVEGYIWNRFINSETLLNQSSNMPALFYMLLLSCHPALVGFYPALVASLFLILALGRLTESYTKESALSESFDASFLIGIAALLYLPASVFLVFIWVALPILRSATWRELAVSLMGFATPLLLAYTYFALFSKGQNFYRYVLHPEAMINLHSLLMFSWKNILLLSVLALTGLVSVISYLRAIANNVVKKQKIWWLMLWFAWFAAAAGFLSPQKDFRSFSMLAIPFSFIFSNYFLKSKSKWLPDFVFILLLAAIGINIF